MTTKNVVERAVERVKDKVQPQPVTRQYGANLYPIAEARRHSDLQARRAELAAAERSMSANPINPAGHGSAEYMRSQQAMALAVKREMLNAIESLTENELVEQYCQDILNVQPQAELRNSDGSPLARGAYTQPISPGMY
jgi:hypothetical protein